VAKGNFDSGSIPSDKNARLERQARELRENLIRRKEQSRARSARQSGQFRPQDEDENSS